jgi:hypothetical protein
LFLWSVCLLILGLYYTVPPARGAFDAVAELKARLGLWFVMPAQAMAAAVLPFLMQRFQSGGHRRNDVGKLPFLVLLFAANGVLTDAFYKFQAAIFGNNSGVGTIVMKTLVDQWLFSPLLAIPMLAIGFTWSDNDFSFAQTRESLQQQWYRSRVLPVWAVALTLWMPAVSIVYALPLALQFPIQVVVQCLWGLLLVVATSAAPATSEVAMEC